VNAAGTAGGHAEVVPAATAVPARIIGTAALAGATAGRARRSRPGPGAGGPGRQAGGLAGAAGAALVSAAAAGPTLARERRSGAVLAGTARLALAAAAATSALATEASTRAGLSLGEATAIGATSPRPAAMAGAAGLARDPAELRAGWRRRLVHGRRIRAGGRRRLVHGRRIRAGGRRRLIGRCIDGRIGGANIANIRRDHRLRRGGVGAGLSVDRGPPGLIAGAGAGQQQQQRRPLQGSTAVFEQKVPSKQMLSPRQTGFTPWRVGAQQAVPSVPHAAHTFLPAMSWKQVVFGAVHWSRVPGQQGCPRPPQVPHAPFAQVEAIPVHVAAGATQKKSTQQPPSRQPVPGQHG
jgi:hypothetical protein